MLLGIKKMVAAFLPSSLKCFLRKIAGTPKRLRIYCKGTRGSKITKQYLIEKLRQLGLRQGMVVAVHSSLSRLGFVEGGAQTVIDALLAVVGEQGTIMMPTFTGFSQETKPVFDARKTPSRVGTITEAFRKMPNAERSLHPTHSCAAIGPKASFLLKEQKNANTLFGKNTPFCRLMEANGFVLCLGIGIEMMSMYHVAEDLMPLFPVKVYNEGKAFFTVIDWSGKKRKIATTVHDAKAHEMFSVDAGLLEKELLKKNALKKLGIGESYGCLMPAKETVAVLKEMAGKGNIWYKQLNAGGNKKKWQRNSGTCHSLKSPN